MEEVFFCHCPISIVPLREVIYLFWLASPGIDIVWHNSFGLKILTTTLALHDRHPGKQFRLAAGGGHVCLISKSRRRPISDKSARYNLLVGVSGLLSVCSAVTSMSYPFQYLAISLYALAPETDWPRASSSRPM